MTRPRLLDLFCGAGGAAMGYFRAGFDVVGVDIKPMPRYPFEFHQGDALEYLAEHGWEFDVIHASPPCQAFTQSKSLQNKNHMDLLTPSRELLNKVGKPWIIENVPGALMRPDLILCGSMFGLSYNRLVLFRHRWFESGGGFVLSLWPPASCNHKYFSISIFGHTVLGGPKYGYTTYKHPNERENLGIKAGRIAMGINWMTLSELSEAIPPAYTEFIGRRILEIL